MARQYLREARLTIGAGDSSLVTDALRIEFRVPFGVNEQRPATVTVWNLSTRSAKLISKADSLLLEAGYAGRLGKIVGGEVSEVEHRRSGVDRATVLTVGSGEQERRITPFVESYENASLHLVVNDIAKTMGVEVDFGDVQDVQIGAWGAEGGARETLDKLLHNRGIGWHEKDSTIFLTPNGGPATTGRRKKVSPSTGMVGSPSVTESGITGKVLLDHALVVNDEVDVESDLVTGVYRVVELEHRGDTWGNGEFVTEFDADTV